jgi:hypothetical protein
MARIDTPPGGTPDGFWGRIVAKSRSFVSDNVYGPSKSQLTSLIRESVQVPEQRPNVLTAPLRFLLGATRRAQNPMAGEMLFNATTAPIRFFQPAARGLSTVGTLSVGINLADAVIKHDRNKAIGVLGTTATTGLVMEGLAGAAGARAVPIVGEVVGGVFAAKDAYDAARSGHQVRAAASGLEAGLYLFSLSAGLTGVGTPVALVAGGAAVTLTAARTLRDNWSTVSSWFDKWSNDFAAIHAQPSHPSPSGLKSRQFAIA